MHIFSPNKRFRLFTLLKPNYILIPFSQQSEFDFQSCHICFAVAVPCTSFNHLTTDAISISVVLQRGVGFFGHQRQATNTAASRRGSNQSTECKHTSYILTYGFVLHLYSVLLLLFNRGSMYVIVTFTSTILVK